MSKRDPRGHALTVEASAGSQVTNPLLRIASQAMNDMQRIGAPDAIWTATAQRNQAAARAVEVRRVASELSSASRSHARSTSVDWTCKGSFTLI